MAVSAPNLALEESALPTRERVRDALARHFLLRLDMIVILTGTFGAGLVATRLLLYLHVNHLGIRYGLAIALAFGTFLLFVRVWLAYVAFRAGVASMKRDRSDGWFDSITFSCDGVSFPDFDGLSTGGGGIESSSIHLGGGKFGGGGASGSWGGASDQPSIAMPLKASGSSGTSVGSKSGGSGFDIGGDDDFVLIVLVIAFIVAVAAAVCYLIWAAPVVLTEAAFNAALTGALAHQAKKATAHGWMGPVVRKTILPFLAVLAVGVALGWYAHNHCPSAVRLSEAFHCVSR